MAFEKETVLVLGAGASRHYGYPLGEKLIDEIRDSIDLREGRVNIGGLDIPKRDASSYKDLKELLYFYDPITIDSFLTQQSKNNPAILQPGKTLILYHILRKEILSQKLFCRRGGGEPIEFGGNWYRLLFNALISSRKPEQLLEEDLKLKIITFNYDVSLEYYLYSRFIRPGFFTEEQALKFLEKMNNNIGMSQIKVAIFS